MKRSLIAAALALAVLTAAAPAEARHRHRHRVPWCGIYMMQLFHKTEARLARAIEWAKEGVAAGGPCVGCLAVWSHHVGKIVGGPDARGRWLVHSGNDGNAVRTRYRFLSRAVAFRRL
ncbi:hypothetical protein [Bradyrhizobium sp. USDA 4350]